MELVIEQKVLADAVKLPMRCVSKRSPKPILGNLALSAVDGKLTVSGTDLVRRFDVTVPVEMRAAGGLCVDGSLFASLVARLPKGPVTIRKEPAKYAIVVTAGKSRSVLPVIPIDDFPLTGEPPSARTTVGAATLRAALVVKHAMSTNDSRPFLHGVSIRAKAGRVHSAGCDGGRITVADSEDSQAEAFTEVLIPAASVTDVGMLAESTDGRVTVAQSGDRMWWSIEGDRDVTLSHQIGEKPVAHDILVERALTDAVYRAKVSRETLMEAVARARVASPEEGCGISLRSVDAELELRAHGSTRGGEVSERVDLAGPLLISEPIGINAAFLADALAAHDGDDVELCVGGPIDPVVIISPARQSVIMPMRM
jgi:DNA polymerase-3 subunit beta